MNLETFTEQRDLMKELDHKMNLVYFQASEQGIQSYLNLNDIYMVNTPTLD
jgi:hypothetical protein